MRARPITLKSSLPPAGVQSRLAAATDVRAASASRLLELHAYGSRPPGLPRRGWLKLDWLTLDGFRFSYIVNRSPWPIIGNVRANHEGSVVTVGVPIVTPEACVRILLGLTVSALFGIAAVETRGRLISISFVGVVALCVVVEVLGWQGAWRCARRIASVAADTPFEGEAAEQGVEADEP
jgi:hypothetical protein